MKDTLFLTDGEIAKRLGLDKDQFETALPALLKEGFPRPDALFAGRRYWPHVRLSLIAGTDSHHHHRSPIRTR